MEFLLRNIEYNQQLTFLIIGALTVLACIKLIYSHQFDEFLGVITNGKYLLLHNKGGKKTNLFNHLFYLFFVINLVVFIYISLQSLDVLSLDDNRSLLYIAILINLYFIGKYFLEKTLFEILDLNSTFEKFNFQRLTFINFIGIYLLLLNLIFLYFTPNPSGFLVCFSIATVFILYLLSIIFIVLYNQKIFLKHWFYFILYLCALEISPFLIGAVLILTNILK